MLGPLTYGALSQVSAVTPWYLSGGAPTPLAVYQPKGAASQAASYVNIVNPGTYDTAPGVAPTWATGTGWTFNGVSQYLIIPTLLHSTNWSVLIRISSWAKASAKSIFGEYGSSSNSFLIQCNSGANVTFYHNATVGVTNSITSGVTAIGGDTPYIDGVAQTVMTQTANTAAKVMWIGAINSLGQYSSVNVSHFALWNTNTGHATWMPAVSAAVALL